MNERRSCCDPDPGSPVSREDVRDFYSKAAVTVQKSLCCPATYDKSDLSHIPQEALNISYGCGSPVNRADIREGEVVADLGSGGGIDCFIAAKYVGKTGRVYGIDMTEEMLAAARKNAALVGDNLGYHNVEFRHGFLETIPLEDQSVDLAISNCVINLSPRKVDVFKEIRRILKPGGRFLIADIISDKPVPVEMRNDRELWGECVSGALTMDEFLGVARESDFRGLTAAKDYLWKEVEGIKFYSYLLQGHKFVEPEGTCCCKKLLASYVGPFDSVTCDGKTFPLGVPVEVDEEFAALLRSQPYAASFDITDPETETPAESSSCCG